MKNIIEKIKAFVKKNYVACTVVGSLILVILASIIIVHLIKSFQHKIELSSKKDSYYQYFDVTRNEFYSTLDLEDDKIVKISSKTYNVYENSPLYHVEKDEMIIPKNSSIVFYYQENLSYRLPKYSEVILEGASTSVISNGKKKADSGYFIYDGEDLYIIPSNSILNINGNEVALGAFSYVIANKNYVTYYDYSSKIANKIENIESASLVIKDVAIDLLKDVTVYNDKVTLINTNVNSMEIYLED